VRPGEADSRGKKIAQEKNSGGVRTPVATGKIAAARRAAFSVLMEMESDGGHAEDLLHGGALDGLELRDRGLATALVMGVLRWQMLLDAKVKPLLRPDSKLPVEVWVALRLGLFQLWFMERIPAHAALGESVELVKQSGHEKLTGLVNAVLRKLSRTTTPKIVEAAVEAHPAWMVRRWQKRYGAERTLKICAADQETPVVSLRVTGSDRVTEPGDEAADGDTERKVGAGRLVTAARRVSGGGVVRGENIRAQDEGSQLVAEIAAIARVEARRVLDACAAPGGKTAVLAERLSWTEDGEHENEIVASDVSEFRLRTTERLWPAELAGRVRFAQADATRLPEAPPFVPDFDLILCDAPCSGTGTLGRNPEIKLRLVEGDLARQAERQRALLEGLWPRLAVGGALVYATCSLEPEENEAVVSEFMAEHREARLEPVGGLIETLRDEGRVTGDGATLLMETGMADGCLRTLPGVHPCDGFFVAVLTKIR
jgi:16S rRNA (cytosine967-C5)-methyltransferase